MSRLQQQSETPLKWPRVFAYSVTNALAIVAASSTLNSIIKAYRTVHHAIHLGEAASPLPGVTIQISISDIISAGSFLAAGEILLANVSYISLITVIPWILPGIGKHIQRVIIQGRKESSPSSSSRNTRRGWSHGWRVLMAWWIYTFVWSLCSAAVTLDWALHRDAKGSAYLNGVKLPDSVVSTIQKQLGINASYWSHGYTRFFAIAPWPMLAFALLSMILSVLALNTPPPAQSAVDDQPETKGSEGDDDIPI